MAAAVLPRAPFVPRKRYRPNQGPQSLRQWRPRRSGRRVALWLGAWPLGGECEERGLARPHSSSLVISRHLPPTPIIIMDAAADVVPVATACDAPSPPEVPLRSPLRSAIRSARRASSSASAGGGERRRVQFEDTSSSPPSSPAAASATVTGSGTDEPRQGTGETPTIEKRRLIPIPSVHEIPPRRLEIISAVMNDVYDIPTPRGFQLEAINYCAFQDDVVLAVKRKTAEGKSMVPIITGILRGGVVVVGVPLIGLGSDQVENANKEEHNVEAYHINEHKLKDAHALRQRLLNLDAEECANKAIFLFMNPQELLMKSEDDPTAVPVRSPWLEVLAT